MKTNVHYSLELGKIIHALQLERGVTSLYINAGKDNSLIDRLQEAYEATDVAIQTISKWKYDYANGTVTIFENKDRFFAHLISIRAQRENMTFDDIITVYTDVNQVFIRWMVNAVKGDRNNDFWADIVAYHMLINGKECTGIERAIGTFFFTNGKTISPVIKIKKINKKNHNIALDLIVNGKKSRTQSETKVHAHTRRQKQKRNKAKMVHVYTI